MTREEFAKVIAYITTAIDKELSVERLEVYFDLLGDLDFNTLSIAAKRVIPEHPWATFPSIAELRAAASATVRGKVSELSPAEAWKIAWEAAANMDPEVEGNVQRVADRMKVPPLVLEAMRSFGLNALCYGKEPVGVVRGQFLDIYEQLAAREKRAALLPAQLKYSIEHHGKLPSKIVKAIGEISRGPEDKS